MTRAEKMILEDAIETAIKTEKENIKLRRTVVLLCAIMLSGVMLLRH